MDIKELEKVWGLKHMGQDSYKKCNDELVEHYRLPVDKYGNWVHIELFPSRFEKYGAIETVELLDEDTEERAAFSAYREGCDMAYSSAYHIKATTGSRFWSLLHIIGYEIPEGGMRG